MTWGICQHAQWLNRTSLLKPHEAHPSKKIEAGKFLVCDSENVCFFTRSLYLAEEQLEEMELGYGFPYSTYLRKAHA